MKLILMFLAVRDGQAGIDIWSIRIVVVVAQVQGSVEVVVEDQADAVVAAVVCRGGPLWGLGSRVSVGGGGSRRGGGIGDGCEGMQKGGRAPAREG